MEGSGKVVAREAGPGARQESAPMLREGSNAERVVGCPRGKLGVEAARERRNPTPSDRAERKAWGHRDRVLGRKETENPVGEQRPDSDLQSVISVPRKCGPFVFWFG
jgi:hypothetical protein